VPGCLQIEAIRSATADLLLGNEPVDISITVSRYGTAKRVQVRQQLGVCVCVCVCVCVMCPPAQSDQGCDEHSCSVEVGGWLHIYKYVAAQKSRVGLDQLGARIQARAFYLCMTPSICA